MRKKIILRLGLVGVVAAAGGASAFAAGCSGDDNTNGPTPDSGTPDGTGFSDGPATDSNTVHDSSNDTGEAATPPVHAKVLFVNAAADLPPVRICIGLGTPAMFVSGVYPLPNSVPTGSPLPFPAVFPGTGGPLPDITDLQSLVINVFLINATKIAGQVMSTANETDCPTLLGADGQGATMDSGIPLTKGVDYFQLPMAIPKNTFNHGNVYMVALEGCGPGDTSPEAALRCGTNYPAMEATGGNNLSLQIYQLDNSAPAAATMNVQVLHASQAWDGLVGAQLMQPISNTFGISDQTDGAAPIAPIAQLINYGAPITPDAAAPQTVTPADYASLAAYDLVSAPDGGPLLLGVLDAGPVFGDKLVGLTFPQIQALSGYATIADGGPAGPLYLPGANFTLVWVGDPSQPEFVNAMGQPVTDGGASSFNPGFPHFLMFPNNPAVPTQ